jgi:acetyl-CoA C-acetyltransferase
VTVDGAAQPVIIGVSQITNRGDDIREPLELVVDAVRAALDDARVPATEPLASVEVVSLVSWAYEDLAATVAAALGRPVRSTANTPNGGDQPTRRVVEAGRRAMAGGGIHVVVGGEAMRSAGRGMASGAVASWTPPPPGGGFPDIREFTSPEAYRVGLHFPPTVYPLYEHGLRARLGQTRREAQAWSAALWADMAVVAAQRPGAWFDQPASAERLLTIDDGNRMINDPYPKLMNAHLGVDQAAAAVVTDAATARRLGVDPDRQVHLWAGAGASDSFDVLGRVAYDRSPAMELVLDAAFAHGGLGGARDELSRIELYSCFPCVPKLALTHLGWDPATSISVTGGLTAFGGPGNAYMLCAITAMVDELRGADDDRPALLYGQGEFVTKHHALVVGRLPRPGGALPADDEPARQTALDAEARPGYEPAPDGPVTIESLTIAYDRDGAPSEAIVIGRLADGRRGAAVDRDPADLAALTDPDGEPVGRPGTITASGDDEPNRFRLAG